MDNFAANCRVEIQPDPDTGIDKILTATCEIETSRGLKTLSVEYNLRELFDKVWTRLLAIHESMHAVSAEPTMAEIESAGLGSLYRRAARVARSVAKSSAVKTLREKYKQVAPYVRTVAEHLPYGNSAIQLATNAEKLVRLARGGSRIAVQKIRVLRRLADNGNSKASNMIAAMNYLDGKIKESKSKSSSNVSGWAYNRPFRSNLAAMELDTGNPRHVLRGAYHRGLG